MQSWHEVCFRAILEPARGAFGNKLADASLHAFRNETGPSLGNGLAMSLRKKLVDATPYDLISRQAEQIDSSLVQLDEPAIVIGDEDYIDGRRYRFLQDVVGWSTRESSRE
jgi:hypothetical protein